MGRLIDLDAAIEAVVNAVDEPDEAVRALQNVPQVVGACKDCCYWKSPFQGISNWGICQLFSFNKDSHFALTEDVGFCNEWDEKREGRIE